MRAHFDTVRAANRQALFAARSRTRALRQLTNLVNGQYTGYALFTRRTVGDQPGRDDPRYLGGLEAAPGRHGVRHERVRGPGESMADRANRTNATARPLPYGGSRSRSRTVRRCVCPTSDSIHRAHALRRGRGAGTAGESVPLAPRERVLSARTARTGTILSSAPDLVITERAGHQPHGRARGVAHGPREGLQAVGTNRCVEMKRFHPARGTGNRGGHSCPRGRRA